MSMDNLSTDDMNTDGRRAFLRSLGIALAGATAGATVLSPYGCGSAKASACFGRRKKARECIADYESTLRSDAVFDLLQENPDGIKGYKPPYKKDTDELFRKDQPNMAPRQIEAMLKAETDLSSGEREDIIGMVKDIYSAYGKAEEKENRIYGRLEDAVCSRMKEKGKRDLGRSEYLSVMRNEINFSGWEALEGLENNLLSMCKRLADYASGTEAFSSMGERRKEMLFRKLSPQRAGDPAFNKIDDYEKFTGFIKAEKEIGKIELEYRKESYK
ncbi:MAG: hypothetical protein R6U32_01315 [Candidatus Woesearchaeota archaeon]